MPQVSELDPITVFGDVPRMVNAARRMQDVGAGVAPRLAPRDTRNFSWWRLLLGMLVIAVWIAAAVSASGASITLSAEGAKNADNSWNVRVQYVSSGLASANLHLYLNGKRAGRLAGESGTATFNALAEGNYSFTIHSSGAASASAAVSNTVTLGLGAPARPAVSDNKRAAARLLMQASFGPQSLADIESVEKQGAAAWIDAQFAAPWATHENYIDRVKLAGEEVGEQHPNEAIWQNLIWGDARLRARVALALSEIMVISNIAPDQKNEALVSWMDMLYRNAFGNYRKLLEDVTLHPAMGYYLNMLGNDKEDLTTGRMPNENYAREVLQLFSIGLAELDPDGSVKRDGAGKAIPTYDQNIVQGFAAAFTGWNFAGNDVTRSEKFDHPEENWTQPMRAWSMRHSRGTKKLLGGVTLAAGQTAEKDLGGALDNIAAHANVAPFMSKRLIQFLVTSNPSPAYIARVGAVWNNNGLGERGDLKAVVRAILLDSEARSFDANANTYGKVREPMVKFVHFVNAMQGRTKNNRNSIWWLDSPDDYLGQSPLLAPSVFNFFSPAFTKAGAIAQAGLVVPELQMVTDTQVVGSANFFTRMINNHGVGFKEEYAVDFDTAQWESIASDTARFLEQLNWVWFAGGISAQTYDIIARAMNKIEPSKKHERMELAFHLAVIAPEFSIQR
jgi:uncharacterized protein (DUF1800 family)